MFSLRLGAHHLACTVQTFMDNDPVMQLAEALLAAGIALKGNPVMDDRIHRVDVEGKPGGKDGAYRAVIEGDRAYGWFQNWQIHPKPVPWHAEGKERPTREQRRHLEQERAARHIEHARAQLEQHERVSATCNDLWAAAAPADGHLYLARKGVPSHGLRQGVAGQTVTVSNDDGTRRYIDLAGQLFVPMKDIDGKAWSLQFINDDGRKWYHPGGRKEGCHFVIGALGEEDRPLFLCEGYATASSVHWLAHNPVVACFDAGNFLPVARVYRARSPERPIFFGGDNDYRREAEGKPNVGKEAAERAARAVGGMVVLPQFASGDSWSDWNDKLVQVGFEDARIQFRRALEIAKSRKTGGRYP